MYEDIDGLHDDPKTTDNLAYGHVDGVMSREIMYEEPSNINSHPQTHKNIAYSDVGTLVNQ